MTPEKFIEKYLPAAQYIQQQWEIPAMVTLAQAAAESGWGVKSPGFNFYGYSVSPNYSGKRQLLKTKEIHSTPNVKYPVIIKITQLSNGLYQYIVRKYFKCYSNAIESFTDYARVISTADRYAGAFDYVDDPDRFLAVICNAGYANNPDYYAFVSSVMQSIKKRL